MTIGETQPARGDETEAALSAWLETGKCMFISGQDYLWNRGITDFVSEYLGVSDFESDVLQTSLSGMGAEFVGLGPYALEYPFENYSDGLIPTDSASVGFVGDQGDAAVMKDGGDYRTLFLAAPFEAIPSIEARQEVLGAVLNWCGVEAKPYEIFLPSIER